MLFRAELAQPGMQFFDTQTFNGLVSAHATLMIFVFIIPAFAGPRELRGAADARRAGHGVPAAERALVLAAADRRASCSSRASSRPAARSRPAGRATRRSPPSSRSARCSSTWASSGPAPRRSLTALNFLVTIITMRAPGMTFWRMPLLVWANFTTSLLVVIATPFIAGSQFFVMFDRVMHTSFFTPDERRLRARLPAHLLVLQPPGRLHHDPARVRDHLRDHRGDEPQADLRLPADGDLAARDPRARLLGLGAPHVRRRAWPTGCACR